MPNITIAGQVIAFPDTGNSPIWSDALVQFAQAVELALSGVTGLYDVQPQVYSMVNEVNNDVDIPNLQFPTSEVRSANIRYAVVRVDTGAFAYEGGNLLIDYNGDAGIWEISRDYVGDGKITFSISNTGQVRFSTTALGGTGTHTGSISFAAQALTK
jgi:hypothetical protein